MQNHRYLPLSRWMKVSPSNKLCNGRRILERPQNVFAPYVELEVERTLLFVQAVEQSCHNSHTCKIKGQKHQEERFFLVLLTFRNETNGDSVF